MAVVAKFGDLRFGISRNYSLFLQNIRISVEQETKDKTKSKQTYVTYKSGKPLEISFSAILHYSFCNDVAVHVKWFMREVQRGSKDYFYLGGKKLFPFKMTLVRADVEEVQTNAKGKMVCAKVNVTMKQCSTNKIPAQKLSKIRSKVSSINSVTSTINNAKASSK